VWASATWSGAGGRAGQQQWATGDLLREDVGGLGAALGVLCVVRGGALLEGAWWMVAGCKRVVASGGSRVAGGAVVARV
jgi:hypothetical protein